MRCSLASAPVEVQQIQFLFLCNFKRTILQNTGNCTWHLLSLKKACNRVPRKVLWWAVHLGVLEWLGKILQAMYVDARSRSCVKTFFSEECEVNVVAYQGSVLGPLLFI